MLTTPLHPSTSTRSVQAMKDHFHPANQCSDIASPVHRKKLAAIQTARRCAGQCTFPFSRPSLAGRVLMPGKKTVVHGSMLSSCESSSLSCTTTKHLPVALALHFFRMPFFCLHELLALQVHVITPFVECIFSSSQNSFTSSTSPPPSTTQNANHTLMELMSCQTGIPIDPSGLESRWKSSMATIRLLDGLAYSKEGRHRRVIAFMAPTLDQTLTLADMSCFCFLRPCSLCTLLYST